MSFTCWLLMSFTSWLQGLRSAGTANRTDLRRPRPGGAAPRSRPRLEALEDRAVPSTFTVLNTLDSGAGSFRAAIAQVNADANPGIDTIDFAIGSGAQTIGPLSALPGITHSVVIDGTSQPGFAGTPLISISAGILSIYASNCTVAGLNLNRAGGDAVDIYGSSNTIGGTTPGAGNVISKNGGAGVYIHNRAGKVLEGNIIGAPSSVLLGAGNLYGVRIDSTSNTIGGTTAGARNVISGNYDDGVLLEGSANLVEGNYIGTDVTGTSAPAHQGAGVDEGAAASNTIGGTAPGADVISLDHAVSVNDKVIVDVARDEVAGAGRRAANRVRRGRALVHASTLMGRG